MFLEITVKIEHKVETVFILWEVMEMLNFLPLLFLFVFQALLHSELPEQNFCSEHKRAEVSRYRNFVM